MTRPDASQLEAWARLCEAVDFEPEPGRPVDCPFAPHHEDTTCWYYVTDTTGLKLIACRDEEVAEFIAASREAVPALLAEVAELNSALDVALDDIRCAEAEAAERKAEAEGLRADVRRVERELTDARADLRRMEIDLDDALDLAGCP